MHLEALESFTHLPACTNVVRVDESENMHIEETKLWGAEGGGGVDSQFIAIYII